MMKRWPGKFPTTAPKGPRSSTATPRVTVVRVVRPAIHRRLVQLRYGHSGSRRHRYAWTIVGPWRPVVPPVVNDYPGRARVGSNGSKPILRPRPIGIDLPIGTAAEREGADHEEAGDETRKLSVHDVAASFDRKKVTSCEDSDPHGLRMFYHSSPKLGGDAYSYLCKRIPQLVLVLGHITAWCSQPTQNMTQLPLVLSAGMEPNTDSTFRGFLDRGGRLLVARREVDQHKVPDHLPFEIRMRPMLREDLDLPESLP